MLKTITKSALFSSATLWLWSVGTQLALAQAKCYKSGVEVPCEELAKSVKSFFAWGIGGFLFVFALIILTTVFWIMMIVHAARHPINNKGIWIVVMIFTGIIGAIIYYFAVKRKFNQQFS
jgi:hypothetical protein